MAMTHAAAQSPPPRPYAPVAITRPAASDDASFIAFRGALAAAAKNRIYAELAALVLWIATRSMTAQFSGKPA